MVPQRVDLQKRLSSLVGTIDGFLNENRYTRQHHSTLQISVTTPLHLEDCVASIFREGLRCAVAHGTIRKRRNSGDPESIMHTIQAASNAGAVRTLTV